MPFIGRAFTNGTVYVGPALFEQARIVSAIGYADISGEIVDVTGPAQSFSSSERLWGGAAQIGMTYFLGRS